METLAWSQLALAYVQAALPRIHAHSHGEWEAQVAALRAEAERIAADRKRPYVFAADVVAACKIRGYGALTVKLEQTNGRPKRKKR